jgi:hypothetical protein
MNMLRHRDISDYLKVITAADSLQRILEKVFRHSRFQVRSPPIATEGHEMKVPHLLVALKTHDHVAIL